MKNINTLEITNVESDTEHGFFFVVFGNGESIQCCLQSNPQDLGSPYLEQVHTWDNGHDYGICRDVNAWAVENGDWEYINQFLLTQARKNGIRVVT